MRPKVLSVIMGGGRGTRLHPLTKERCKPAVPLAGKYRLVDIPISNCINSDLNRIFLLTQFNTASLHRHIQESYKFDPFGGGFVDILAAEQTERGSSWYQGTADAVRQNLHHFGDFDFDYLLILSGDQLYRMPVNDMIDEHIKSGADVTLAAKALPTSEVHGLGLMRVDDNLEISEFVEKPTDPKIIEDLAVGEAVEKLITRKNGNEEHHCLASMGIYLFNRDVLFESLDNDMTDFGKEVIPSLLGKAKLNSFVFDGYWEDIGTVKAFFDTSLSLAGELPPFNFYESENPVYTRARYLPSSKVNRCNMDHTTIADGCIIQNTELSECSVGVRSIIKNGTKLDRVVMIGGDFYETPEEKELNRQRGIPDIGIGENCQIQNAIIDKNARIGNNVVLKPDSFKDMHEGDGFIVRDGILVVLKNAVIADNTVV